MKNTFCVYMTIGLLLLPVLGFGQAASQAVSDEERGWFFSQRFQGTSNAAGLVMKTNSTFGYDFNRYVQTYAGAPFYFVRAKGSSFTNGVGNAFAGLLVNVNHPAINYSSDVVATAPTGDQDQGFSTGHATVDWTNTFSKSVSSVTPYGSVGFANTISDTSFFVRPFSSKGMVTHFEGGAGLAVAPKLTVGASGYGIQGSGEQHVVSKLVKKTTVTSGVSNPGSSNKGFETQHETVGTSDVANDRGFSTWMNLHPDGKTDFQIGYSRSSTYQLNSMFFGMGIRVGH